MKAISIYQPWADLIAYGVKKFETRSWGTSHIGWIAIHAGLHKIPAKSRHLVEFLPKEAEPPTFGAVIAFAWLSKCLRIHRNARTRHIFLIEGPEEIATELTAVQERLGDFTTGRYAWQFDKTVRLPEPIYFAGKQRIFNFPDQLIMENCLDTLRGAESMMRSTLETVRAPNTQKTPNEAGIGSVSSGHAEA